MDALRWKKLGFAIAFGVVEAIEKELVPHTDNKWDDSGVMLVKSTLLTLQAAFIKE